MTLEERIATLGRAVCTRCSCPAAWRAITLVDASLLASGDEVLIPDNAYGPGKELARRELSRWGITHRFYDAMDPPALAGADRSGDAPWSGSRRRVDHDGVPGPAGARARGARRA